MKKHMNCIVAAGLASAASAQDLVVTVDVSDPTAGTITAEFLGVLPPDATGIGQVLCDVSITLSGNGPITFTDWDPSYEVPLVFGPTPTGPVITGNGSNTVEFAGSTDPTGLFGGPPINSSNPLLVATFTYGGDARFFRSTLIGQNAILFRDDSPVFGFTKEFITVPVGSDEVVTRTFELVVIPAPASAALLGLGVLAGVRRRR